MSHIGTEQPSILFESLEVGPQERHPVCSSRRSGVFSFSVDAKSKDTVPRNIYYTGVISSALIHILLCLVLYGAFAPSSNLPLIETASFVDLVTLEEVSSTQDPLRYQASLAVKDSSAASLEQRAAAATQRSLPSKQRLVAEKDSSKQITASIKGVGFNAASKQGVLSASYLDGITSRLERYKRYPQRGLQRHLEAEVLLSLTINTDGEVANSAILSSSGFPFFDDEVLAMVKRAAPFSPPVQEGNASTITVIVPISFKLN